jgi:hypothetical protein
VSFVAFPIFSLIFPFHFVQFALGVVFRAWFHYFFLSFAMTIDSAYFAGCLHHQRYI